MVICITTSLLPEGGLLLDQLTMIASFTTNCSSTLKETDRDNCLNGRIRYTAMRSDRKYRLGNSMLPCESPPLNGRVAMLRGDEKYTRLGNSVYKKIASESPQVLYETPVSL